MYRKPGRGRVLLLVFLALSILLITLDYRSGDVGLLKKAKEWSVAVVAPIQRGLTTVFRPVGDFFSAVGDIPGLREENRRLGDRVEQLESENERAVAALEENKRLRATLELPPSWGSMKRVSAQVFSSGPGNYSRSVQIDKGSDDGIAEDMAVVAPEGLVGKVLKVSPSTSVVLLLTDPRGGAGARVLDIRDTGAIQGDGDSTLQMNFVGKNSVVEVGDSVVTSGQSPGGALGSIFPPGIPIGVVSSVEIQGGQTTKEIEVQAAVDFSKLDFVTVLLESGPRLREARS